MHARSETPLFTLPCPTGLQVAPQAVAVAIAGELVAVTSSVEGLEAELADFALAGGCGNRTFALGRSGFGGTFGHGPDSLTRVCIFVQYLLTSSHISKNHICTQSVSGNKWTQENYRKSLLLRSFVISFLPFKCLSISDMKHYILQRTCFSFALLIQAERKRKQASLPTSTNLAAHRSCSSSGKPLMQSKTQ